MFANHGDALRQHLFNSKRSGNLVALVVSLLCAALSVQAQNTFNSGSTGADGAFAPATTQTIVVPVNGTFNYTSVNIPAGVTITYNRGTNNKPLVILASGDVVIAGIINLDGKPAPANRTGGLSGPGGFNGGTAGYGFDQSFSGVSGDGPGGGGGGVGSATLSTPGPGGGGGYGASGGEGTGLAVNAGDGGPKWGTVTILPLLGGSGGGGGGTTSNNRGGGGGGGGGAILIASSGTITINGQVLARGGDGLGGANASGGGGSGGAIRLIANTVNGTGSLQVSGGSGGCLSACGGAGGRGYIRLEAYDYNSFTGTSSPTNIISLAFPHPITPPNSPSLRIASVGGVNSPSAPLGSLQGVPDIIVPSSQANPVNVALEGANLPVGTIVQVILTPATGARTTVQSSGLAGSESASTASASVTLPGGMSVISALAVIDLTLAKANPMFMEGERINRIEVAATFGGASELTYVTQSGRRIRRSTN
jgi:hypothetical protein